jgi:PDZ domain-containing secreted protein
VRFLSRSVPPRVLRPLLVALCLAAGFGFAATLRAGSGYGVAGPGPVVRLSGYVSGELVRDPGSLSSGWFAFTTVNVEEYSYLDLFEAKIRGEEVMRLQQISGSSSAFTQMRVAKQTAAVIAASLTGAATPEAAGALVADVLPGSPAHRAGIRSGDVIRGVDDAVVRTPDDLRRAVRGATGVVRVRLDRDIEGTNSVEVVPTAGRIGVEVTTFFAEGLTDQLDVPTKGVGGPSAGLLLTLAFLDARGAGDLTAGMYVAGTGTIAPSGAVGAVAGVTFKVPAARDAGAEVFFYPAELESSLGAELTVLAGSMRLVPVTNLGEALAFLCDAGATDTACNGATT